MRLKMTEKTIEIFGVNIKTNDYQGVEKLESTINSLLSNIASYGEVRSYPSIPWVLHRFQGK